MSEQKIGKITRARGAQGCCGVGIGPDQSEIEELPGVFDLASAILGCHHNDDMAVIRGRRRVKQLK